MNFLVYRYFLKFLWKVQKLLGIATKLKQHHFCREEMTNAIRKVCKETQANSIKPEDITEEMLEQSLYTQISGLGLKPDLVSMS